jgi:hypothetical protein
VWNSEPAANRLSCPPEWAVEQHGGSDFRDGDLKVASAAQIEQPKLMPLEEIAQHPEWCLLSDKQRMFCISFIESGLSTGFYDAETAARMAYDVKSYGPSARVLGNQLLTHIKIKKIIDLHFGRTPDPLNEILSDLRKAIRKSLKTGTISVATQKAIEFYEKHAGMSVAVPEPSQVKAENPEAPSLAPEGQIDKRELKRREKEAAEAEQRTKNADRERVRINEEFGF